MDDKVPPDDADLPRVSPGTGETPSLIEDVDLEGGREFFTLPPIIDEAKFFAELKRRAEADAEVVKCMHRINGYVEVEKGRIVEVGVAIRGVSDKIRKERIKIAAIRKKISALNRQRLSLMRSQRFQRDTVRKNREKINKRITALRQGLIVDCLRGHRVAVTGPETGAMAELTLKSELRPVVKGKVESGGRTKTDSNKGSTAAGRGKKR
jgi:hypothetical protein